MGRIRHLARRLGGVSGQIVIPALFVFPSLMLFIYLIYETAKLSKEKIKHQFALDAAAFVEMTNYSDFLNRTAYVNGAFPMRIFSEGFGSDYTLDCTGKTNNCQSGKMMRELLFNNGVFPTIGGVLAGGGSGASGVTVQEMGAVVGAMGSSGDTDSALDTKGKWDILYHNDWDLKNRGAPKLENQKWGGEYLVELITLQNIHDYWINWDEANAIFRLYVQVFQLLGSVEDAQLQVLKRLSANHSFLQKSYWLNSSAPISEANQAVSSFRAAMSGFQPEFYCYDKLMFYGNATPDQLSGQGMNPIEGQGYGELSPKKPIDLTKYNKNCKNTGGGGLFQIAWVDPTMLKKMREGVLVMQRWTAPGNYFRVDFNKGIKELGGGKPLVRARVTCGEAKEIPFVWPNPTPKFQVRLYP